MRAAELRFPNPSTSPSWLDLAINVFNDQVLRWDTNTCGGGLRWQIFKYNIGYDYKHTVSNGAFFQLAARLARYTGNQTYADWATRSYDWTSSVGFISDNHKVFDGASVADNCSVITRHQWTYAAAAFLYGSAVMTNFVRSISFCLGQTHADSKQTNTNATWKDRTNDLLSSMSVFFTGENDTHDTSAGPGIMVEVACEPVESCGTVESHFKGLTAQWMGEAIQVAPFTKDKILGYLRSSAEGAAKQCSGGHNGTTCGTQWTKSKYDGRTGLGQELNALSVFLANLAVDSSAPVNANTTVATPTNSAAHASGPNPSSTATSTSGTSTASTTPKPSSGSQRTWAVSWTLLLVIPAAWLAL